MLKKIFAFMLAVILLVSFTACGKKVDSIPGAQEYHGEGEIQGGIKSDEEIASITEEAENNTTTEEPSYEDNTGHEPDGYSTGNFQDYWQGDDYFDIVAFAEANGCERVRYLLDDGTPVKDESEAHFYCFYFHNKKWMVQPTLGCLLVELDNDFNRVSEFNVIYESSDDRGTMVSVSNKNNATLSSKTIEAFVAVVNAMNANPNSSNPLADNGIEHAQLR